MKMQATDILNMEMTLVPWNVVSNHFDLPAAVSTISWHQGLLHEASFLRKTVCFVRAYSHQKAEIIGGSMREEDYDALVAKMESLGMDVQSMNSTLTFVNDTVHTVDLVSASGGW